MGKRVANEQVGGTEISASKMSPTGTKPVVVRRRVGKIELLRFVFGITVICFHLNGFVFGRFVTLHEGSLFGVTFFRHASQSVEFFFLLSGYLMAASVDRRLRQLSGSGENPDECIPQDTVAFVIHKAKPLFPYMLLYGVPMLLIHTIESDGLDLMWYLLRVPSLFFLEKTGINDVTVLGTDWYLSTMMLAMVVLYPLCRRYKDLFTHVIAPIVGLVGVGFLMQRDGALGGGTLLGITHKCNIRGLAELSLGCASYAAAKWLRTKKLSSGQRLLLSITELLSYALCFVYLCSDLPASLDGNFVLLLVVGLTLSFAQQGLLAHSKVFENNSADYLGALSLPIFLNQYLVMHILKLTLPHMRARYFCLLTVIGCILLAVPSLMLVDGLGKLKKKEN